MSQSLLLAFIMFAIVMFFTPGPNNIMVLSSGLTYGFRRTVPHMAGITIGFAFMVGAVGLGFGTIFLAYPVLQTILKYAGAAYLIYLAFAIAFSRPPKPGEADRRGPMTFWGAAMFQWVNVKGWVIVIGTITAYAAAFRSTSPSRAGSACRSAWFRPRPGRCLAARSGRSSNPSARYVSSTC